MTNIKIINAGMPKAGPYSHAVKVDNLIFISGQIPIAETNDIEEQTLSVFKKVKKILEAAGASVAKIVKVTVFLKDLASFQKMNLVYKRFFKQNDVTENFPARTTVEVSNLPGNNTLIEIDVIAAT